MALFKKFDAKRGRRAPLCAPCGSAPASVTSCSGFRSARYPRGGLRKTTFLQRWPNTESTLGECLVCSGPPTRFTNPMLVQWWASVAGDGPASNQYWASTCIVPIEGGQQTHTLTQCWISVGPTLIHHRVNVSCMMGRCQR